MPKIIRGVKTPDGITYRKTTGGMRKIQCTRCHSGIAVEVRNKKGEVIYQCQSCRARFSSTPMG